MLPRSAGSPTRALRRLLTDGLLGGGYGGQNRPFRQAVRHALKVEAEAGQTNEEKGKSDDSEEEPDSPTEGEHLGLKLGGFHGEDKDPPSLAIPSPVCPAGFIQTDPLPPMASRPLQSCESTATPTARPWQDRSVSLRFLRTGVALSLVCSAIFSTWCPSKLERSLLFSDGARRRHA